LRDANVTIVGGWHSPLEKGILDALIEGQVKVAFFAAKGLKGRGFQQKFSLKLTTILMAPLMLKGIICIFLDLLNDMSFNKLWLKP